jgi:serine-type D-Ala-D-Ala carboxypeptidase (penicillin-binding protein 5/6)
MRLYVDSMAARKRPTLYALQTGSRRRRPVPRPHPAAALAAALVLGVLAAAGYAFWVVHPLLDRAAGAVPPGVAGSAVSSGDGPTGPATGLSEMTAKDARTGSITGVSVGSGVLVDATSGRVLWMQRPHVRRAVASLTKLMTAHLIALRPVTGGFRVPDQAVGLPGEDAGLVAGQGVRTRDMLAAALVTSANDAATALAIHRAGSVRRFAGLMNREAARLHLRDTHYSNPSGIFDTGNRSSAWDVAQLARVLLRQPALARLVGSKVVVSSTGADYVNTNTLLWTYSGAIGIKTGFTDASGLCLAAAATRDGRTLIAVVLDARPTEFAAAERVLDWGFRRARRR